MLEAVLIVSSREVERIPPGNQERAGGGGGGGGRCCLCSLVLLCGVWARVKVNKKFKL